MRTNTRDAMNTTISIEAAPARKRAKLFLDDKGRPSDIAGPDLRKARSIEEVIAGLKGLRTGAGSYSSAFYRACKESGIHLSTLFDGRGGGERLLMYLPCDDQEEMRRARYEALRDHLHAKPQRRQAVMDLVNMLGHFADNRPYASVEEAAEQLIAAGGRVYILPDGTCEETLPYGNERRLEDSWNDYAIRRMFQRYEATLRRRGAREEMAELVRANGRERSGSIVWERKDA